MTRNNPASSHTRSTSQGSMPHRMRAFFAGVSLLAAANAQWTETSTWLVHSSDITVSGDFCLTADKQPGFVKWSGSSVQCDTVSTEASGTPVTEATGEQKYAVIAGIQDPEDRKRAIRWLGDEREAYYDWLARQENAVIDQKTREGDEIKAQILADIEKRNTGIKNGVYQPAALVLLISEYEIALADRGPKTQIVDELIRSGMLSTIAVAREQLRTKLAMRQK